MVKETEKEPDQEISWLKDFKPEAIKKASEVDIKPKLTIDGIGIEYAKICTILTLPKKVNIPKEKAIGNSNLIFMMDLEYEGVSHNFICQSGSFRFQLGVLMNKLGFTDVDDLIGLPIRIWKTKSYINTPVFKGQAEVYQINLM